MPTRETAASCEPSFAATSPALLVLLRLDLFFLFFSVFFDASSP